MKKTYALLTLQALATIAAYALVIHTYGSLA